MPILTDSELLLISKSYEEKLRNFAYGALLARRSRKTIKQLQIRVAKDRLTLAKLHLNDAIAASRSPRYTQLRSVERESQKAVYIQ